MPKNFKFSPERAGDYQKLRKNIIDVHGARGAQWFEQLEQLEQLEQWGITLLEPVKDLSYNLVFHAISAADNSKQMG